MNFHRIFIIFWTIAIFKLFLVFPKKYLKIFVKLKRQKFFPFFLRNCNICLFILNVQFWRLFFFEFVHFLSAKVHSLYEVFLSRKRRKFRLSKRWFFYGNLDLVCYQCYDEKDKFLCCIIEAKITYVKSDTKM